jgi:hypothetical protein
VCGAKYGCFLQFRLCGSGIFWKTLSFRYMSLVPVSNLQPHMFTYRPVDVTSHLIVSISVFRGHKCCVLLRYSAVCIYSKLVVSWRSSHDSAYCVLDLGLLLLNSPFLPLDLRYITPGGFHHLLMVIQVHARIVHALLSSWVLIPSYFYAGLSRFLILGQQIRLLLLLGNKTNDNSRVD